MKLTPKEKNTIRAALLAWIALPDDALDFDELGAQIPSDQLESVNDIGKLADRFREDKSE